jgi:hypothetical protein
LLRSIDAASSATTILGGSFLKTTGYIGLAAAAGYGIGTLFNDYILDPLAKATTGFDSFGAVIADMVHGPGEELNINLHQFGLRLLALREAQQAATLATEAAGVQWKVFGSDVSLIGGKFQALTDTVGENKNALLSYLDSVKEAGGVARDLTLATDLAAKGFTAEKIAVHDVETGLVRYVDALKFSSTETEHLATAQDKSAEAMAKMALESDKLALEWEKLASHEREIVFQARVDLQIESVKAQAEAFTAIMKSVDTAIESTGTTLLGLANLFTTSQRTLGGGEILSLLRKEEERRAQSFDLQKKLIDAQLQYLNASTDRLRNGDALITIQAEGLEPELRAVLFKIIELSHVEASGVAGPLLLGLPTI